VARKEEKKKTEDRQVKIPEIRKKLGSPMQ